ncbi:MAG: amidohydrolase [Proteobacteria bacterium]|nr:amidohydrolase [Pseudomonadota bacterium]
MIKKNADILIKNGLIITMDADGRIIEGGLIAISGAKIAGVDSKETLSSWKAEEEIDAKGCIVMPGLVNTHTHLPMSLFRGLADDLPLMTWLNDYIFPAEGKYLSPETVKAGTCLSCAEMLLGGITTVCDGYFYEDHVAEAVLASGLRAVLAQGVIDYPAPGAPDPQKNIHVAMGYADKWKERSSLISPSIFCHSPYTCSTETLKKAKQAACERNLLFQIHAAETNFEWETIQKEHGKTPIQYLDSLELLDEHTLLVHAVHVDGNDISTIAKRKSAVSHNPESNMKLASGISPTSDLLAEGIRVGLGTDSSASNNDLDLFSEMGSAAKLHKIHQMDPTAMKAEDVVKMATIGGSNAIGLGSITGSLETGKQADIIIIDTRKPHLTPMYHPLSHLVYTVKSSDVRDVMVAGKLLVRRRHLLSLDMNAVMDDVMIVRNTIVGKDQK